MNIFDIQNGSYSFSLQNKDSLISKQLNNRKIIYKQIEKLKLKDKNYNLILKNINSNYDIDNAKIKLSLFQLKDGFNLYYSNNKLITGQMRTGKVFTSAFPFLHRKDYKNILIIAPKIVLQDPNGWQNSILDLAKDLKIDVNLLNISLLKNNKTDKIIIEKFNNNLNNKNIVMFHPEFLNSKLGKEFFNNIINNKKSFINITNFDLLLMDEFHKYILFNGFKLSSKKGEQILKIRFNASKDCWLMSATPANKYNLDLIGYYLFSDFKKSNNYPRINQFYRIYNSIVNNYFNYQTDRYNSIIIDSVNFRKGQEDILNQIDDYFRVGRLQIDINPNLKQPSLIVEQLDLPIYQQEIYNSLSNELSFFENFELITSEIAKITYQRQISLDHRLIKNIITRYIIKSLKYITFVDYKINKNLYYEILNSNCINLLSSNLDIYNIKDIIELEKLLYDLIELKFNNIENFYERSIKSINLTNFINNYDFKNPIVVFSNFSSYFDSILIDEILKYTNLKSYEIGLITGKVSTKKRQQTLNEFNNNKIKVLLCNIQATAEGVNFSNANVSIYLDLPWRYNTLDQSKSRITNLYSNNDEKVIYYYLIKTELEKDSIDEVMLKYLQNNKENIKLSIKHYK